MNKQAIYFGILVVGVFIGASALSAFAQTWTPPASSPPDGNVPAPINVGPTGQAKTGLLALSNFLFNPTGTANIPVGAVLTAKDVEGTVEWKVPTAGPTSGPSYKIIACHRKWLNVTGGTWNSQQWNTNNCVNRMTNVAEIPGPGCVGALSQTTARPGPGVTSWHAISPGEQGARDLAPGVDLIDYPNGGAAVYTTGTLTTGTDYNPAVYVSVKYICPLN